MKHFTSEDREGDRKPSWSGSFPSSLLTHTSVPCSCPSTSRLTDPPSSPLQEWWAIFSLVISLLTGEMKKTLLFATYTESIIEFLTWSACPRPLGEAGGEKQERHAATIPTYIPLVEETAQQGPKPPLCSILQNSAPTVRTAQRCQVQGRVHSPTLPSTYHRQEVLSPYLHSLKKWDFS